MNKINESIKSGKVIAVLGAEHPVDTVLTAQACSEGGINLVEIMMNSPNSLSVLEEISKMKNIIAGCGTVLDLSTAENAYNAGARFIVSPHTDADIIDFSRSRELFVVSGAATSSEIVNAWKLGTDMVKVFPAAQLGGPGYIRALRKPLGFIDYMATGGIKHENIIEYFKSGVSLVGISGALFGGKEDVKIKDVQKKAEQIMKLVKDMN